MDKISDAQYRRAVEDQIKDIIWIAAPDSGISLSVLNYTHASRLEGGAFVEATVWMPEAIAAKY